MAKFIINGGKTLTGEITVGGSKNAALPILCATILSKDKSILKNVPDISDIRSMIKILEALGAEVKFENHILEIDPSKLANNPIPEKLVSQMRASILIVGAAIGRLKELKMPFPGGCVLGKRSISAHTDSLEELGCRIIDGDDCLHVKANKLKGKKIILPELSVTATENAVMCACLAEGKTEIRMCATEPHVQDLCHFLNKMGAKITGIGTNNIIITGVKALRGTTHSIIGDYLEAGTFAIAAVATEGDLYIKGINTDDLDSLWQKFDEIGVKYKLDKNSIHCMPTKKIRATKLRTAVHPSFPTDLQAPFSVLLTKASGISKIFETLFEGRLNYLFEIEKMGARIEYLNPHQAIIIGGKKLKAMPTSSLDIRAGAAMVVAALMAEGTSEISNIHFIDRGYEKIDEKLRSLGADIIRVE